MKPLDKIIADLPKEVIDYIFELHAQNAVVVNVLKAIQMVAAGKISEATATEILNDADKEIKDAVAWLNTRDAAMLAEIKRLKKARRYGPSLN